MGSTLTRHDGISVGDLKHDVLPLDVQMHHLSPVHVCQGQQDLKGHFEAEEPRHRCETRLGTRMPILAVLLHESGEVSAGTVLQHQVPALLVLKVLMQTDDVRVVHGREHVHFSSKKLFLHLQLLLCQALTARGLVDSLHGAPLLGLAVLGQDHISRRPFAKSGDHLKELVQRSSLLGRLKRCRFCGTIHRARPQQFLQALQIHLVPLVPQLQLHPQQLLQLRRETLKVLLQDHRLFLRRLMGIFLKEFLDILRQLTLSDHGHQRQQGAGILVGAWH